MPKKRHSTEEIIGKLSEVEVLVGRGGSLGEAIRSIGVTDQSAASNGRWRCSQRRATFIAAAQRPPDCRISPKWIP